MNKTAGHVLALSGALIVAGCAGTPPTPLPPKASSSLPEAPPADGSHAAEPPPAQAPLAPAASSEPLPAPIVPAETSFPSGADRSKLELLKGLCPLGVKQDGNKVLVGCRACPPFSGADGVPDGKVVEDPESFFPLEVVVAGSFSRPAADQVALVFQGCESHAENYGGTVLAERAQGAWGAVFYATGLHPSQAKAFRRSDGRDILVGLYSDVHQGTATQTVLSFDFAQASPDDPEAGYQSIVVMPENGYSVCWGLSPDTGVVSSRVESFSVRPGATGSAVALSVKASYRHAPYSDGLKKRIEAACARAPGSDDAPPTIDVHAIIGPRQPRQLEFSYDGAQFVPTPATSRWLSAH